MTDSENERQHPEIRYEVIDTEAGVMARAIISEKRQFFSGGSGIELKVSGRHATIEAALAAAKRVVHTFANDALKESRSIEP